MVRVSKKVIVLISFILIYNCAIAQEDSAAIIIKFSVSHIIDTQSKFTITYPLIVYLGKNNDLSISENKLINDSIKAINKPQIEMTGNEIVYKVDYKKNIKSLTSYESSIIVRDKVKEIFAEYVNVGPYQYKIIDTAGDNNWNLANEYKEIAGYKCQKATSEFKGRKWEAWFTVDIPLSSGPWKLRGLPGLILLAYDSKQEVIFTFNTISKLEKKIELPFPKSNCSSLSRNRYYKILKEYADDPIGFMGLQNGVTLNTNEIFDKEKMINKGKLKLPNNPIEIGEYQ
jgi:GLPGLI family protein